MKNILNHDAVALIIARIAATIIPTPIDFNNGSPVNSSGVMHKF